MKTLPTRKHDGYTLLLTLVILSAITILVIGYFISTMNEGQSIASLEAAARADLAMQAGLTRASAVLNDLAKQDDFLVCAKSNGTDANSKSRSYLMGARFNTTSGNWQYIPLISGVDKPADTAALTMDHVPGVDPDPLTPAKQPSGQSAANASTSVRVLPWQAQPEVYWEEIYRPATSDDPPDEQKSGTALCARYAYWIEDMQGYVSQEIAGNSGSDGLAHQRVDFNQPSPNQKPDPPGLNVSDTTKPLLNQIALYNLISPSSTSDGIQLDDGIFQNRTQLLTTDTWKEAFLAQASPKGLASSDFKRDATGRYVNTQARAIEENTITGVKPYRERALIPPMPDFEWIKTAGATAPDKLNLNKLLNDSEKIVSDTARTAQCRTNASTIAQHIHDHLPKFEQRAGGYSIPLTASTTDKYMNYLRCLAAGMIDYADTDSIPTSMDDAQNGYRGMDACPLINEQWNKWRWEKAAYTSGTSKYVDVSSTCYLELWNPTNQLVEGDVQALFEDNTTITLANANVLTQLLKITPIPPVISGMPTQVGSQWWMGPVSISLRPNQFTVIKFTPVVFQLRVGPTSASSPTSIVPSDDLTSHYGLRFKPKGATDFYLVDFSRGGLERSSRTLKVPPGTSSNQAQRYNSTVPAMSYGSSSVGGPSHEANGVGDTRGSFFVNKTQELVNYNNGTSPYGRNLRSNIGDTIIYGSARPSKWPDGGHDTAHGVFHSDVSVSDDRTDPDDTKFQNKKPATEESKFVQRISNAGKFWSITELGNVFDPMMWNPTGVTPGASGDLSSWPDFANLKSVATPSANYCGGSTLRIGRTEHPLLAAKSLPLASALLDLLHVGIPWSANESDRTGNQIEIRGHININTATRDALRAAVAGKLVADPAIQPAVVLPAISSTASDTPQADLIADLIIKNRPYISLSQVPEALKKSGKSIFTGNNMNLASDNALTNQNVTEWNDTAAEETFARLYNSTTVRSRNFRIFITAQSVRHLRDGTLRVLATRSRLYHLFIQPADPANGINQQTLQITHVRPL